MSYARMLCKKFPFYSECMFFSEKIFLIEAVNKLTFGKWCNCGRLVFFSFQIECVPVLIELV